jgi:hypothetical protein
MAGSPFRSQRSSAFGTEAQEHAPHAVGYLGDVLMYEEVTSGQNLQFEGSRCMPSPGTSFLERHARIAIAGYRRDRHVQSGLGRWRAICLDGPVIGTDNGEDHTPHLVVVEKSRIGSSQRSKVGDDTFVVGRVEILGAMTRRGATSGREQRERHSAIVPLKATRHLEGHHRSHAVTEERERFRSPRDQLLADLVGEPTDVLDQGLVTPVLPPWILDPEHRYIRFE